MRAVLPARTTLDCGVSPGLLVVMTLRYFVTEIYLVSGGSRDAEVATDFDYRSDASTIRRR